MKETSQTWRQGGQIVLKTAQAAAKIPLKGLVALTGINDVTSQKTVKFNWNFL